MDEEEREEDLLLEDEYGVFWELLRILASKRFDAARNSPAAKLLIYAVDAYNMAISQEDWDRYFAHLLSLAQRQEGDEQKGLSVGDVHFVVGKCYEEGIGMDKNLMEAIHHYTQGTLHKHAVCQCLLGLMNELGRGVQQNKREALRLYLLSADQGNPAAQNNVGLLYEKGVPGVLPADPEKAAEYFLKAGYQQIPGPKFSLGTLYLQGKLTQEIPLPPFYPSVYNPDTTTTTITTTNTTTTKMQNKEEEEVSNKHPYMKKSIFKLGTELRHAAALGGNRKGLSWLSSKYQTVNPIFPLDAAKAAQYRLRLEAENEFM